MARHVTHYHDIKSEEPTGELAQNGDGTTGPERVKYTAWCGVTAMGHKNVRPYRFGYTQHSSPCPKCQSKKLASQIKENPIPFRLGDRVDMSEDAQNPYGVYRWGYKSVYPVIDTRILADDVEDKVVAFVVVESGWGKKWEVRPWERTTSARDEKARPPKLSSEPIEYTKPSETIGDHTYGGYKTKAHCLASKEAALLLIPVMDEQGILKTRQSLIAQDQEWLDGMKAREAERERESQERHARRLAEAAERQTKREALLADIREALNDASLSNFNRDVMFRVAREAGFTEEELASGPLAEAPAPATAGPLTDEWGEVIG
jgi:hypothetical protein